MSGDSPLSGDATRSSGTLEVERPPLSKDVFVSYASQDAAVAKSVVEALERQGIRCWIAPRDVTPGEFYAGVIVHAIDAAKVTVLILSQNSAASPHVVREVERAASKRHPVISLRIDREPLPADLEYFLNSSQWLDASEGEPSRVFPRLVEAVRKVLAGGPSVEAIPAPSLPSLGSAPSPSRRSLSRPVAATLCLVATAILGFAIDQRWFSKHLTDEKPVVSVVAPAAPANAPTIPEKSVAVLPFVDMSEKKDQEYFSDGLSEELIDMLTKIPELRVPARTSSFYYKGKPTTIADISKALSVAYVLEGSVRKSRNNLRVTAQLIRADNGFHLWSQTYDRKLDDVFKVQDEIAGNVVSELKVSLADNGTSNVATPKNAEAYTLYLQGRAINRIASNKQQYDSAAEYMRKAVNADPTFAKGWAWLEAVLANEIEFGLAQSDALASEMRHASERALSLDPNLADAHRALADIYFHIDWNWEAAEAEYQKAYDLDPKDAGTAILLAVILEQLHGPSAATLALFQKATASDPLNSVLMLNLGFHYMLTGNLAEAEKFGRKSIEIQSTQLQGSYSLLSLILLERHEAAAALAECQHASDESEQRSCGAVAYCALGRKVEANPKLSEMERLDATTNAAGIAEAYAFCGENGRAFAWLDRAYQQHDAGLESVNVDPLMKNLNSDPRWKTFLQKMRLPEYPIRKVSDP